MSQINSRENGPTIPATIERFPVCQNTLAIACLNTLPEDEEFKGLRKALADSSITFRPTFEYVEFPRIPQNCLSVNDCR